MRALKHRFLGVFLGRISSGFWILKTFWDMSCNDDGSEPRKNSNTCKWTQCWQLSASNVDPHLKSNLKWINKSHGIFSLRAFSSLVCLHISGRMHNHVMIKLQLPHVGNDVLNYMLFRKLCLSETFASWPVKQAFKCSGDAQVEAEVGVRCVTVRREHSVENCWNKMFNS